MSEQVDPALELRLLVGALKAHVEYAAESGAHGLPRATPELRSAREALGAPQHDLERTPAASPSSAHAKPDERPRPAEPRLEANPGAPPAPAAVAPVLRAPPVDPEERGRRLTVLCERVRGCTACGLHAERTQAVFARGTGTSGLCFVGEGPGADEDLQGEPFVGKAGQLLDKMIEAMGFSRDEVYVCNIVKCRPPNNRKPEPDEMAACRGYLEEQLSLVAPKVIVALGATAVQGLLGTTGGITRLRGNWRLYKGEIAVMPTFHPAYLLRTPRAKREVWDDLKEVLRHLGRSVPSRS